MGGLELSSCCPGVQVTPNVVVTKRGEALDALLEPGAVEGERG
jgi:hypothetical protein